MNIWNTLFKKLVRLYSKKKNSSWWQEVHIKWRNKFDSKSTEKDTPCKHKNTNKQINEAGVAY